MRSAASPIGSFGQRPTTQSRRKTNGVTDVTCSHDVPLEACRQPACREIRQLLDRPRDAPLRGHGRLIEDRNYGDKDGRWWERTDAPASRPPREATEPQRLTDRRLRAFDAHVTSIARCSMEGILRASEYPSGGRKYSIQRPAVGQIGRPGG